MRGHPDKASWQTRSRHRQEDRYSVLSFLGGFVANVCTDPPSALRISSKKGCALLAYVAMRPEQDVSREQLADLLWGDRSTQHARQALRQCLASLRRDLPAALFRRAGPRWRQGAPELAVPRSRRTRTSSSSADLPSWRRWNAQSAFTAASFWLISNSTGAVRRVGSRRAQQACRIGCTESCRTAPSA